MNAPIRQPVILTDAQYEAMARKGAFVGVGRVELRGGVVVAMSPVHLSHSTAMMAVLRAADRAIASFNLRLELSPEISIRFGGGFQPTPDVVIWDPAGVPANYDGPLPKDAVKLVIEIADASIADDLGDKLQDYAQAGLGEYWVVDVRARVIHQCSKPQDGGYKARTVIRFGEPAAAVTLDLQLDTSAF
jgi:Uma2 family endonuclease